MKDLLILVDENDSPIGELEKMRTHELGLLHRAFSVFIFNTKGELLLQQRADKKYHSAGLWTNTCCSHPKPGEKLINAARKRLMEEIGLNSPIKFAFHFIYKANFSNNLIENEFDHVFFGVTDDKPQPNKIEVKNWKYIDLNKLREDILENPNKYTDWLKICFERVVENYETNIKTKLTYGTI